MQKHKRNAKTQKKCKNTKEMQKKKISDPIAKTTKENETLFRPATLY
jgi:hypothetical protein